MCEVSQRSNAHAMESLECTTFNIMQLHLVFWSWWFVVAVSW